MGATTAPAQVAAGSRSSGLSCQHHRRPQPWESVRRSECHAVLVIPNGKEGRDRPAKVDGLASQDVIGRHRQMGLLRWGNTLCAVAWLVLGTVQFVRIHQWWGLAFAAGWTALAVTVWVVPKIVISDQGVRYLGRRIIPWSQVIDVVARPVGRWPKKAPVLVLLDGHKKSLAELSDTQIDGLRTLAREHGSPIPS
jgi:hypothetical protein